MAKEIRSQGWGPMSFYILFGLVSAALIIYYLSNTLVHFTTNQQFPINSFKRFPLTFVIFPAEVFSFAFSIYFVYCLVHGQRYPKKPAEFPNKKKTRVAILIPVFNEPKEIVARTLDACRKIRWEGGTKIYLLDDSANEQNISNMQSLAKKFECALVRRKDRTGFKAGNINNAVSTEVKEEFFAIFDSDQAPEHDFLEMTMDHFSDSKVGFIQTPQHFVNEDSPIERAAKLGTNIFYHSQSMSKAKDGAMPFCGTNAVVRAEAFRKVGGFSYYMATEDVELGMRMNEAGYHGSYVPKILVHGYAPRDFDSYSSQQYRWSNGNLAVLRQSWIKILFGKFSLRHQVHTFFTLGWWLIGLATLIYIIVPILAILFGGTHHTWLPTALLFLVFLNVGMGLFMIYMSLFGRTEDEKVRLSDVFLQYSLITNSMFIYIRAAFNAFIGRFAGFVRTSKMKKESSLWQVKWNLILSAVCFSVSMLTLYMAARSSTIEQLRTFLPVSLWMLFFCVILASSILFVESGIIKRKNYSKVS